MSRSRDAGSLGPIVRALGGELYDGGRRANVPGPGHGPSDRSVSLLLSAGRVVAHSFAGDDWRAVLDHLRDLGLVDRDHRPIGAGARGAGDTLRPSPRARVAAAEALWSEGRPLEGTAAARHLRARGVRRSGSPALRFHRGVPQAVYRQSGARHPALLAAIRDPDGGLAGVEVTYLTWRGAAADLRVARKTVGRRPPGAAVRLDPAGPVLLVGEGVFTTLSAGEAFRLPGWALLGVGNLRVWSPPEGVKRVVIAADAGRPGVEGATLLAGRLHAAGIEAAVRLPPDGFGDWNDWARASRTADDNWD